MAWWHNAKVGDKIVCIKLPTQRQGIKTGKVEPTDNSFEIQVGAIYTIQKIEVHPTLDHETYGPVLDIGLWSEYFAWLFKPVETSKRTTKTGMKILKKILDTAPTPSTKIKEMEEA